MLYKIIPGNGKLTINIKGDIHPVSAKDKDEYKKFFTIKDENITLEMYGKKRTVSLKWLAIIAYYRMELPKGFEEFIFRYRFKKGLRNKKLGEMAWVKYRYPFEVIFSEPVYYSKDFRIIPEFPNYAVSEAGEFINIKTGESIKTLWHEKNKERNIGYPTVSLYHNYFGKTQNRHAHRLIAITWVENDDYFTRSLVDHKDGNKYNFHASNLRYASYSENLTYAYKGELRTDNHPIKVYDSVKKTITLYHSVTEAFKSFGAKPRANLEQLFAERNGYYIAKNRYEIRYANDKADFILMSTSVNKVNKHLNANIKRNRNYQAINTVTKEEIIGSNGVIQKALNLSESGVTGICKKKTFYGDWIIRDYSPEPVNLSEYSKVKNTRVFIESLNEKTNEKHVFKSLREAGRFFKIDPLTIKSIIRRNDKYKSVIFKYIEKN